HYYVLKFQFFIATMLVASTIAAISGNIFFKEPHSGNFLPSCNSENLLFCDFPLYPEKKHL
ncbi:MAG: hypothetical protein K2G16_07250, partial [Lachnospiraceae bacterium]|nr:hypothetical protein [Lachnospiraceae bacterium]